VGTKRGQFFVFFPLSPLPKDLLLHDEENNFVSFRNEATVDLFTPPLAIPCVHFKDSNRGEGTEHVRDPHFGSKGSHTFGGETLGSNKNKSLNVSRNPSACSNWLSLCGNRLGRFVSETLCSYFFFTYEMCDSETRAVTNDDSCEKCCWQAI
jgi:hypothetical protein